MQNVVFLGGVPALLGGGGLERQMQFTSAALRRRGLRVVHADSAAPDEPIDILHAFGNGDEIGHVMDHWRRSPARLVVSPVTVVPQRRVARLIVGSRLPIPAFEPRTLRALARRADALIALTRWERRLLRAVGGRGTAPTALIGNGVTAAEPPADVTPTVPAPPYALVVGTISARKQQAELVEALAGVVPVVVVGGADTPDDARRLECVLEGTGGLWTGELGDAGTIRELMRGAAAYVHLSDAEGQSLAVLEAIAAGTPCVLSGLPVNRELAQRYPSHVRLLRRRSDVAAVVGALVESPRPGPVDVPGWDAVAGELHRLYEAIGERPARLWSERRG